MSIPLKSDEPPRSSQESTIRILIADDSVGTREGLKQLLEFEPDMKVIGQARTGNEAVQLAQSLMPDIILMDVHMPELDGLAASEQITSTLPTIGVIMVSIQAQTDSVEKAMIAGARAFLLKSAPSDKLYSTIRSVYARRPKFPRNQPLEGTLPPTPKGKVIVVFSLQGGTGKTTLATNLAASLMRYSNNVLLMDCALMNGDVGVFLNLQSPNSLLHLTQHVDDLDLDLVNQIMIKHESGLQVLLAPTTLDDAENVQPDQVIALIEKLRAMYPFIVVDTAPQLDLMVLRLFEIADRILLVANPTLPSIKNTRTAFNLMETLGYDATKVQLVLNRVNLEFERARVTPSAQAIENSLHRKPIAQIPADERRVLTAINHGVTLLAKDRQLSPAKELDALAESLYASLSGLPATGPLVSKEVDKGKKQTGWLGQRVSR